MMSIEIKNQITHTDERSTYSIESDGNILFGIHKILGWVNFCYCWIFMFGVKAITKELWIIETKIIKKYIKKNHVKSGCKVSISSKVPTHFCAWYTIVIFLKWI